MNQLAATVWLLMTAAGRMHGIGGIPLGRVLSTLIVGAALGIGAVALWGYPWAFLLGGFSAWAFSFGHGNFYEMNGSNPLGDGPEKIETYFARPVWLALFSDNVYTPAYSWWCMGLKWFLIGAPILPYAPLIAFIGAASYAFSFRVTKSSALAEWLSTSIVGLIIAYLCTIHFNELAAAYAVGASYVGVYLG